MNTDTSWAKSKYEVAMYKIGLILLVIWYMELVIKNLQTLGEGRFFIVSFLGIIIIVLLSGLSAENPENAGFTFIIVTYGFFSVWFLTEYVSPELALYIPGSGVFAGFAAMSRIQNRKSNGFLFAIFIAVGLVTYTVWLTQDYVYIAGWYIIWFLSIFYKE